MYYDVVALGVVVSILFSELTQLSPGGLVVPGYLALCLKTPERIVYTVAVALLAWGGVRLIGNVAILYGRRIFAAMVLASFVISWLANLVLPWNPGVAGCLVAGILAREFERQGLGKTAVSLGIVTAVLALLLLAFGHPVLGLGGAA